MPWKHDLIGYTHGMFGRQTFEVERTIRASFPPKVRSFGFEMASFLKSVLRGGAGLKFCPYLFIMNILSANFGEICRYGPLNYYERCHVYSQLDHVSAARVHA